MTQSKNMLTNALFTSSYNSFSMLKKCEQSSLYKGNLC